MDINRIKRQLINYGLKIKQEGLITGTWGNISVRFEDKVIITPSGLDYEALLPDKLVVVDMDGNILEGYLMPSTELSTHLAIYRSREDVGSIIHTHSVYATAMAATRKAIPAIVEDMASVIGGEVPCAKYAPTGTPGLANNILEILERKNAVLLANHGAIGMGRTLKEAFIVCQILEKSAQIYLFSTQIGTPKPLSIDEVKRIRHLYLDIYTADHKETAE